MMPSTGEDLESWEGIYSWRQECKLVQPLCEVMQCYLVKLMILVSYQPSIPFLENVTLIHNRFLLLLLQHYLHNSKLKTLGV